MEIKKIKVTFADGLHMRRAADVVKTSRRFKSKIYLCHRCKFANSCSILELMTLAASKNSEVAVIAEGPDEKKAVKNICRLFSESDGRKTI